MARKKVVQKQELVEEDEDEIVTDEVEHEDNEEVEEDSTDAMHDKNVQDMQMKPSNRMEAIRAAVNLLGMLPQDMALNAFDAMIAQIGQEAHLIPDSAAAHNAATMQMKPSFASASMTESIKEAIKEIFGEDKSLSEEFKSKAETIFEAALSTRVALERAEITAQLEEEFEGKVEGALETLTETIDQYISYVAEQWLEENQVAIESTLKSEITEDLLSDMKQVFEAHSINIPEENVDALEALGKKVEELENKLNSAMNENIELTNTLIDFVKQEVIDEMTEGFILTQKEKFITLVEGIDFDENDVDAYKNKLTVVKNKYFPTKGNKASGILQEDVIEDNSPDKKVYDRTMTNYVHVLDKVMK